MIYSIIDTGNETEDNHNNITFDNSYTDSYINNGIINAYNNDKNILYEKFKYVIILEYVLNERISDYNLIFEEDVDETKFDIPIPHIRVNIA